MRVLFDVNHPAQVHLFRSAIEELEADGDDVFVTSREKDVTVQLLDEYGIDHRPLSGTGEGTLALLSEWARRELRLLRVARSFDPDVMVSRLNPPVVHVSRLLGCPNLIFMDTKIRSTLIETLYHQLTQPFVDVVCTPPGFEDRINADRHHLVDFQELAYLHPRRFTPDPEVLAEHGVDVDEPYFVLRFAGWEAYHDVGNSGFSIEAKRELVSHLSDRGAVYITSELDLPEEFADYRLPIPPHLAHHLLYYADLFVGDSGTMSSEAAILGTPAIRTSSMVGADDENIFVELEERYGLLHSFADERRAIETAEELLERSGDDEWARRRARLLRDKNDVAGRMVELIRRTGGGA
jgi:hypothetical protein